MISSLRSFYYYVPPCPQCASHHTGRYAVRPYTGAAYATEQCMKMGELVRYVAKIPDNNLFCKACGYEWHGHAGLKFWTLQKIRRDQELRGTENAYARYKEEQEEEGNLVREGLWDKIRERGLQAAASPGRQKIEGTDPHQPGDGAGGSSAGLMNEAEIIDRRPRNVIEILFTDDELIEKVLRKTGGEGA